jgi:hypothetical protein
MSHPVVAGSRQLSNKGFQIALDINPHINGQAHHHPELLVTPPVIVGKPKDGIEPQYRVVLLKAVLDSPGKALSISCN